MEPKIKTAKEIKIKAVEQEEAIQSSEESMRDVRKKNQKMSNLTEKSIPLTPKQSKDRAANKRAKKARKINRQ